MNRKLTITATIAIIGLTSCSAQQRQIADGLTVEATEGPARPPQQIYISMEYGAPFTAEAGDTIIVVMEPEFATPGDWCDHRGGTLWRNPHTDILYCENIDF